MTGFRAHELVRVNGRFGHVMKGPMSTGRHRLWSVRMFDGRAVLAREDLIVSAEGRNTNEEL
ncbi:hypothetical protein [Tsukamurella hominis]|uniref:hypothetical protein n=1 Tax=Tsukamurella hominis TaxID=1970232 RepID=UPI0039E9D38B